MVRVHLSPPIFDLALLLALACVNTQCCVRRLAKYKNYINRTLKTEQSKVMKDKREIGYYDDRLEKS